ncbi:MAG TPA: type II secretion system protein [Gemmatimonadaceae bacterium]|nr:type II secretion system protein [Gemmatimonadaceae bacterium]
MKSAQYRMRRRSGFTLIETVVTVGLIAVLAAFVVPTVIQKAGAGDPVKVQNDLNTIGTAIESFVSDTKAGIPHQMSSLTARPTANVDALIDSTFINVNQAAVWNGPYMAATLTTNPSDSLATGYTAFMMNFLDRYDTDHNVPEHNAAGAVNPTFSKSAQVFVSVQVHGLTYGQATVLNNNFDGTSDLNQADSSNTTGRFRWMKPSNGTVVAYYMAVPVTHN